MTGPVERGRDAFDRHAWSEAHFLLAAEKGLGADDLERLSIASYLIGRSDDSDRALELAYEAHVRDNAHDQAALAAYWLSFSLFFRGEAARAGGWIARAEALVEAAGPACPVRGFLLLLTYLEVLGSGDAAAAMVLATEMVEVADATGDHDLRAMGLLCQGEASVAQRGAKRGMRYLDEAMLIVRSGELSPILTGIVYCAAIETCMNAFEIKRAGEWTDALHGWCTAQPDLVPYRGQCLVHRSQVLQAHGEWADATSEIAAARDRLSNPTHPALGLALYQQGELLRLRGDMPEAAAAYRAASEAGFDPAPGLALLRLAEGNTAAASAAVNRLVDEHRGRITLAPMLAAAVEVRLAAGDIEGAHAASSDLTDLADTVDATLLHAIAELASGSVGLAEGNPATALVPLRSAHRRWHDLGMPYEAAQARVQISLACRALGDDDAADLELDAARLAFDRLDARPDRARVVELSGGAGKARPGTLSARECEVLRLVAKGMSNRDIATDLTISEHTVARHLQNIFMKLNLSSRAAATAYAYEHGLV